MSTQEHFTFLSWVRDGAAARITQDETLASDLPNRATLQVEADLESSPSGRIDTVETQLALYGPADVRLLQPDEIVRMEPSPGTAEFEPNYLPTIEFDRPDLPWLFSPVRGTDSNRQKLRPWLCLVVVPKGPDTELRGGGPGRPLLLDCAIHELPDLSESWWWAHAQVTGLEPGESIPDILAEQPERTLSRLISPRRLEGGRAYLACVVPTFQAGVEAAMDEPVVTDTLVPAWPSPSSQPVGTRVTLPVYHHWEFSTGEFGDFESIARRLRPFNSDSFGLRRLDVSEPGAGVVIRDPADPSEILPIAGALAGGDHSEEPWTTPAGVRFEAELRTKFDQVAEAATTTVGFPLYGRWYAGKDRPPAVGATPHWLRDLNLDPRLRVYAGLGVRTVQKHQEALMTSAWDQLDEVEEVNQVLRQAQLARDVMRGVLKKRIEPLSSAEVVSVTRGAHTRVDYDGASLRQRVETSDVPEAVISNTMRRMARPGGPLARRAAANQPFRMTDVIERSMDGTLRAKGWVRSLDGVVTLDDVAQAVSTTKLTGDSCSSARLAARHLTFDKTEFHTWMMAYTTFTRTDDRPPRMIYDSFLQTEDEFDAFFSAAITHQQRVEGITEGANSGSDFLDLPAMARSVTAQLEPDQTLVERVEARLNTDVETTGDPLEPVMAAPYFPQPTSELLRELEPEFLLPGASGIPRDTVSLVRENRAFITSYLIGMNHELAAELLWRGYPTDQRGTYFRRFWDRTGYSGSTAGLPADDDGVVDIEELDKLPEDLQLLGNAGGSTDSVMLVVRGSLIERFPNLWVYANPAEFDAAGTRRGLAATGAREPLYSGKVGSDAVFFAFDLTVTDARGDGSDTAPGWFFVFQQQATETRFGLDISPAATSPPTSTDDLAWTHAMDEALGDRHLNVANSSLAGGTEFEEFADEAAGTRVAWGVNSAHMARSLMQWPVRMAFHADALLP